MTRFFNELFSGWKVFSCFLSIPQHTQTHTHTHLLHNWCGRWGSPGVSSSLFSPLIFPRRFLAVSLSPSPLSLFLLLSPSPFLFLCIFHFTLPILRLSSRQPIYMPAGPHPLNVLTALGAGCVRVGYQFWFQRNTHGRRGSLPSFGIFLCVSVSASVCRWKSPLPLVCSDTRTKHLLGHFAHTHTHTHPHLVVYHPTTTSTLPPPSLSSEAFITAYLGPCPDVKCLPGWWR